VTRAAGKKIYTEPHAAASVNQRQAQLVVSTFKRQIKSYNMIVVLQTQWRWQHVHTQGPTTV